MLISFVALSCRLKLAMGDLLLLKRQSKEEKRKRRSSSVR